MTPAERLRAAADRIEGLAKEATEGPWRATTCLHMDYGEVHDVVTSDDSGQLADTSCSFTPKADAAWIATMSPVIAGPLVEWLRYTAEIADPPDADLGLADDDCECPYCLGIPKALELADAILAS